MRIFGCLWGISTFINQMKIEIDQVGISMILLCSMTLLVIWDLIELPIKGRSYTWSNMQTPHFWSRLTGFLPQWHGQVIFPAPWLCLWLESPLTISHAMSRLVPESPRQIFLDLKFFGSTILVVSSKSQVHGSPLSEVLTVHISLVVNSSYLEGFSSSRGKTFQICPSRFLTVIWLSASLTNLRKSGISILRSPLSELYLRLTSRIF